MRAVLLTLLLAAAVEAEDGRVHTVRLEWEPSWVGWTRYRPYPLTTEAPAGMAVPASVVSVRFGELVLAEGLSVLVALDVGSDPQRLWVDTDLDRDLGDETSRDWRDDDGALKTTDTIVFRLEGEPEPLPIKFIFWRPSPKTSDEIRVLTAIQRRGVVELAGRMREISIADGNGNLRFDDAEHDRVYVDLDGDGELSDHKYSHELVTIGVPFALGGKGYVVRVLDPLARAVELHEVAKAPPPAPRWRSWLREVSEPWKAPRPPARPLDALKAEYRTRPSRSTLYEVGLHKDPAAFAFLDEVHRGGKDEALRTYAVERMGYEHFREHAKRVAQIARTGESEATRVQAIWALHRMDAPARDKVYTALLKEAAAGKSTNLAANVAHALAATGSSAGRSALARAFKAAKVFEVQREIYRFGTHGDPEGPPDALVKAGLADRIFHFAAVQDLWLLRDPRAYGLALKGLRQEEQPRWALEILLPVVATEGERKGIAATLEWATHEDVEIRRLVVRLLRPLRTPDGVAALQEGLRDRREEVRALCADLLGAIPGAGVTEALVAAARRERNAAVVARVAGALGDHGDARAVVALREIAGRADLDARAAAIAALARIGVGDPEVAGFFAKLLAASRWEDRVLALDAAARSGDKALAPSILANLDHAAWQVRLAAAQALARVRVRAAIEPLIGRLGKEDAQRVRFAIGDTLFALTGKDMLDVTDAWQQWWSRNRSEFEVPAELPRRQAAEGGTVARFYGLPVYSERVCFVIDASSSMDAVAAGSRERKTRLEVATREVLAAAGRLKDGARVNAVFFRTAIDAWKKSLVPLSRATRGALEGYLARQAPQGKTNLCEGLLFALEQKDVDTVFLLSDGTPTAGEYRLTADIVRAVRRLNQTRRVAIHTVSIGRDSDLLRRLAEENGGTYVRR